MVEAGFLFLVIMMTLTVILLFSCLCCMVVPIIAIFMGLMLFKSVVSFIYSFSKNNIAETAKNSPTETFVDVEASEVFEEDSAAPK